MVVSLWKFQRVDYYTTWSNSTKFVVKRDLPNHGQTCRHRFGDVIWRIPNPNFKNQKEDTLRRICNRCFEGGSLPPGSLLENIINRKPPRGEGVLSINVTQSRTRRQRTPLDQINQKLLRAQSGRRRKDFWGLYQAKKRKGKKEVACVSARAVGCLSFVRLTFCFAGFFCTNLLFWEFLV